MRRTNAALTYPRTQNLRVVQLLLGHSKLEITVRKLGIDVDDAPEIAHRRKSSATLVGDCDCPSQSLTGKYGSVCVSN
jgi:hypothetical protein